MGKSAMNKLKEKNYNQVNYMVQQFCFQVKIPFTGDESGFETLEWDIERKCPALKKYVTGSEKKKLSKDDWIIDLNFETVKGFFDPVINEILKLIEQQLKKSPDCSVTFLVGGFSESKYLQSRVKQKFGRQIKIAGRFVYCSLITKMKQEHSIDVYFVCYSSTSSSYCSCKWCV